jgi:hypothetical protein
MTMGAIADGRPQGVVVVGVADNRQGGLADDRQFGRLGFPGAATGREAGPGKDGKNAADVFESTGHPGNQGSAAGIS